jgi:isopentenyldiphosphate isomerase
MKEQLETYKLDGTFIGNQDRKEFYKKIKKEFIDTGSISRKVKTVRVLIMNSSGRIYLQKRSNTKNENPGLYDKTVGGHVTAGNTFELTVVKECAEELGFPCTILSNEDFKDAVNSIDLEIIGIFRKIDHIDNFDSIRVTKEGDSFIQPYITDIYLGYYDGAIRFVDGESSGIETFTIEELKKDIDINPDKYTGDLKFMIEKYSDLLVSAS